MTPSLTSQLTSPPILVSVVTAVSLVLVFTSFLKPLRGHSVRLLAAIAITSLAIYSENWFCLALAIAVISTNVASERFVERVAAIIRGNRYHFESSDGPGSSDEIRKLIRILFEDDSRNEPASGSTPSDTKPEPQEETCPIPPAEPLPITTEIEIRRSSTPAEIEDAVYTEAESQIDDGPIRRHVALSTSGFKMQLDGLVRGGRKYGEVVVELKFIDLPTGNAIAHALSRFLKVLKQYEAATSISPWGFFAFVVTVDPTPEAMRYIHNWQLDNPGVWVRIFRLIRSD